MSYKRTLERARLIGLFMSLLLLLLPVSVSAQRRSRGLSGDSYHFGYLSGSAGYSMLDSHFQGAYNIGGAGGSIGAGYEFRNSGFWANVGFQISMHRSKLNIDPYTVDFDGLDTQGKAAILHYRVNQTDNLIWNSFDIPVLFGYYTHGFHLGAGLKFSFPTSPRTQSVGTYTLSATNKDYNITFENMPDRGYTDYRFDRARANRVNTSIGLIGEIGYDLLSSLQSRSRLCHVLKLSFYVEYGLNSSGVGWEQPQPAVDPQKDDATRAVVNPYLNTLKDPGRIAPFFCGAKITYMIGGSRTARSGLHHGCMCYN